MSPKRKVTMFASDFSTREQEEQRIQFFLDRTDDGCFDVVGLFVLLRQVYTNDEAYRVLAKMDGEETDPVFGHTRGPLYRVTVITPPDELADRVYNVVKMKPANP